VPDVQKIGGSVIVGKQAYKATISNGVQSNFDVGVFGTSFMDAYNNVNTIPAYTGNVVALVLVSTVAIE
jgi:hypothetical protein